MTTRVRLLTAACALAAVGLFVGAQVRSQEKAPPQPPTETAGEDMMAKWQALNAKGPEHERFKEMVGTWDTLTRMWMAPGAKPMETKGTATFRLILDGRYVEQRYKCLMGDQPFEGLGIEGFDRLKKKYVSIWMDSTSTGIFMSEGTVDPSGKVYTYYGKVDDPLTGQKDKVVKCVIRQIDNDRVLFEMFDRLPGGTEFRTMEITYTRRK